MHRLVEESHITLLIKFHYGVKKKLKLCNDHPYYLTEKVLDRKGMHGLTLKRCKTLKGNNLLILITFKITFEYAFKC